MNIDELIRAARPYLDSDAVADFLGISVRHFRERVAVQPGFPAPRHVPGVGMRWRRTEVERWVDEQPQSRRSATSAIDGA